MTYNVFGGTLSLTQSINQSINLTLPLPYLYLTKSGHVANLHSNTQHQNKKER